MEETPSVEPTHIYCDSARVISAKEVFLLAVKSGGNLWAFMFSPAHAKRLFLALKDQIDKYEAAYGVIEASLPQGPVLSSIQPTDLAGEGEKEG